MNSWMFRIGLAWSLILLAVPAMAHGVHHHESGWLAGLLHPFHGADHLLAALAVGLWAGQHQDRSTWLLPVSFATALLLAALVAHATGWALPLMEPGIAATVVLLGAFIAFAVRMPAAIGAGVLVLFAAFHGWAHGLEQPAGTGAVSYLAGLAAGTLGLHLVGVLAARRLVDAQQLRLAGGFLAGAGTMLLVGAM
ncbi:MAG: HupE/UreJ family protein [Halothiobacillaceae bacterium]